MTARFKTPPDPATLRYEFCPVPGCDRYTQRQGHPCRACRLLFGRYLQPTNQQEAH